MSGFTLCADFNLFPDNHRLGPNFSLAAFNFAQVGGNPMFVNITGNERGLQFPQEGIEISLPVVTDSVVLRLGTFAGKVEIEVLNSARNIVRQQTVQGINMYITVRLLAPEIATIILREGGNEGIIPSICVTVCTT